MKTFGGGARPVATNLTSPTKKITTSFPVLKNNGGFRTGEGRVDACGSGIFDHLEICKVRPCCKQLLDNVEIYLMDRLAKTLDPGLEIDCFEYLRAD